jgi:hypothetical protein
MGRTFPLALRSAFLACAGLALSSLAQETTPPLERKPFRLKYFTTEDNLPQNQISCLKQTRDGYLWAGTYFGLARFNGVEFTKFNHFNTPELPGDTINALAEDSEGTLWIGTSEGLASYREHQFQKVALEKSVQGKPVWHLASSRSGGIWLHAGNSVMKFGQGHFSAALQTEEVEHHFIHPAAVVGALPGRPASAHQCGEATRGRRLECLIARPEAWQPLAWDQRGNVLL